MRGRRFVFLVLIVGLFGIMFFGEPYLGENTLLVVMVGLVAVAGAAYFWRPRCPNCGRLFGGKKQSSEKIKTSWWSLNTKALVTYKCIRCSHVWSEEEVKSW